MKVNFDNLVWVFFPQICLQTLRRGALKSKCGRPTPSQLHVYSQGAWTPGPPSSYAPEKPQSYLIQFFVISTSCLMPHHDLRIFWSEIRGVRRSETTTGRPPCWQPPLKQQCGRFRGGRRQRLEGLGLAGPSNN
jgi:hypothetical protein